VKLLILPKKKFDEINSSIKQILLENIKQVGQIKYVETSININEIFEEKMNEFETFIKK
jgi:hypothetical protein